ncbi:erbin isoform X3 [Rhincodon typus]|uniref:erbin isoform X3 n=1 Tax=Rhincodon typus TaxID=259920 RepID=UPI00202F3094|nr:erbin isoform X3 [Rhincodon typus]
MDGNRLAILPGFIGKLKQLTYLDVSKNNVEMIDDAISGCENLQDLLLSSNVLQQLPETIGSLKKLTALKVDENQLLSLPDSVGGLACLEEFDCSFNEIEALPPTVGQLENQRTFAADHNFISELPSEIGNWKNVTVLFLHSNKLEYLPEEMGEMQKLKVINLSDNRLKNLPFSFTKLQELTAMWLSENQSKPLIPLQKEVDPDTQKQVLTNYMFPQQPRTEDVLFISDNESFNPSLWEEQRKQRAQVAFECDEDKDEREAPPREGNLKRYPTPYPDELKNMVKTAQSVVHRLKDDGTSDDSGTEMKQNDDRSVTTKNSGVEVTECTIESNKSTENTESNMVENCTNQNIKQDLNDNVENIQTNAVDDDAEDISTAANDEDALEDTENTSSDEEMKMAELRPPLIDTPITQPKIVALCKEKRDDADSLFEELIPNSNQNNSNCSSPSRISDTVSFNTESSQETLHSTPDKTAIPLLKRKNRGGLHETSPLLQNGTKSSTQFQNIVKTHETIDSPAENKEVIKLSEFEFNVEEKLALLQREMDLNSNTQQYQKLLKIGVNKNEITADDVVQRLDEVTKCKSTVDGCMSTCEQSSGNTMKGNTKEIAEHLKNENEVLNVLPQNQINGCPEEIRQPEFHTEAEQKNSPLFSDAAISGSAEELSPQREYPQGPVVKSHSITHIDTGGLKLYDINDNGPHEQGLMVRTPPVAGQGQNIIRSKSASLLSDQSLQPFTGNSSSSSDLLSCKKAVYTFDQNFNPQGISLKRGPIAVAQMPPVPQYNVQYSSSGITKENMWPQRPAFQMEQGNIGSHHHQRSEALDNANYVKHSANMNFSNRNNAQSNMSYNMQPRIGARQVEMWGCPPSERLIQAGQRSTLQRQSSVSSTSSVTLPETHHCRRVPVPEADYVTYRDLHTLGRGPQIVQGSQRPLSARTYSVDGPTASRPHSARPHVTDVPERTMSVSDFNYSRTSPTKRPNVRVKSEHSLLDAQGTNKVPPDWREQVLRHIEAKKLEKSMLSRSFNFNYAAFSSMHSGSCRELHDSQGNVALSVADRRNSGVHMFRYPSQGNSIGDPSQDDVFSVGQQNYSTSTHVVKDIPPDSVRKMHVRIDKNPELGFSISGGIGGRGNPFRPDDNGIFVTRVQPEGPASKLLQPGDKIVQANGYNFVKIEHGQAVSLLKTFQNAVDLIILREVAS